MQYADLTFRDKNPLKRWLQKRRLVTAVSLATNAQDNSVLLDYGSGNGELCKLLASAYPKTRIICYEPSPTLFEEATRNIGHLTNVELFSDLEQIPLGSVDILFCLEVFEHLPPTETQNALRNISGLLKKSGSAIIGVPVEIGFPALYKGAFRMFRRYGTFDGNPYNVLRSFLGFPPSQRPLGELTGGLAYYYEHMGFDYRSFRKILQKYLCLTMQKTSPTCLFGTIINPEVYFIATKHS